MTTDSASMNSAQEDLSGFLDGLRCHGSTKHTATEVLSGFEPQSQHQFMETPFPVNYVSRCLPGVHATHPDNAALSLLGTLLTHKFLLKEVRLVDSSHVRSHSIVERRVEHTVLVPRMAILLVFTLIEIPSKACTSTTAHPCSTERTLDAFADAVEWAIEGRFTGTQRTVSWVDHQQMKILTKHCCLCSRV